jgi:hypothetical protein
MKHIKKLAPKKNKKREPTPLSCPVVLTASELGK